MDRFTANDTKASSVPRVFLAFPFKFGKKMPKAGAKRAIFASQRGSVGDFLGLKAQLIDDDVLGTGDNFPDSDAFCEAEGFAGSLGGNNEDHTDAHIEDLIHLVHGDIT